MATPATTVPANDSWLSRRPLIKQQLLLVVALAVIVGIFDVLNPGFLGTDNISSILQDSTETILLAFAETLVIITGGIDISVGATLGLSGIIGSIVLVALGQAGFGALPSLLVGTLAALAVGFVTGLCNALMITRARVTPFIATLAMLGIATGLTFVLTNGVDISGLAPQIATWGNHVFLGVLTLPIVVTAILGIGVGLFLHRARFGRWTFAIGSNARAARGAGIPVARHLTKIYVIAGLLSAVAGVLVFMRLGTGSPLEGANDELNAIAAVVIGGASLFGGTGTIIGTLLGALIIGTIVNGLIVAGIQPYWQTVIIGVIIAIAVMVQERGRARD
ncbi:MULTISPECIES: ABC transporter permease [unclassified Acidisoma]|jgi:ribose transport system permease protein|uniref:ABC transporter permease n=1 Tax=unclassified Acidisoma TaxID=2634065 RepID=UPI00131B9E9A|nr:MULTISPECIES: ABC transporter permease [unclassified Acidisoma]